jgi:hypothetical protein
MYKAALLPLNLSIATLINCTNIYIYLSWPEIEKGIPTFQVYFEAAFLVTVARTFASLYMAHKTKSPSVS